MNFMFFICTAITITTIAKMCHMVAMDTGVYVCSVPVILETGVVRQQTVIDMD